MLLGYDDWNQKKKELASTERPIFFKEGEIWWCSLGLNLGNESFGKGNEFRRPVLVLKKLTSDSCIILPITSIARLGSWFEGISVSGEMRWVMLHQIRMVHTKRFQRRLATLDIPDFSRVKEKLEALLELSQNHHSATAEIGGISQNNISIVGTKK